MKSNYQPIVKAIKYASLVVTTVWIMVIADDYYNFSKVVKEIKAASSIPFVDADNRIKKVMQCVPDPVAPYTCQASCPLLTPILAAACSAEIGSAQACIASNGIPSCAGSIQNAIVCSQCSQYAEITITGQHGTPVLGIPLAKAPEIKGPFPMVNGQIIYAGSSNVMPWYVGTSRPVTGKIDRLKEWFSYKIAGKK